MDLQIWQEAERELTRIEAASQLLTTPCGDGQMVWHRWGKASALAPLVLLHGGAGSWRHWARNVEALAQRRIVLAGDIPGLGASAMPPALDHVTVATIIADGLVELARTFGTGHLVGFSFGGLLSGVIATRIPHSLRSLTIIGSGGLGLPRSPTPLQKISGKTGLERLAAHRANLAALMLADPARIDALALAIQDWNTKHARLRERPPPDTAPLRDALAMVEIPVCAIYGERDATAYPNVADRGTLIKQLQPEAQFHTIKDAGHWVAYEAAQEINRLLDK